MTLFSGGNVRDLYPDIADVISFLILIILQGVIIFMNMIKDKVASRYNFETASHGFERLLTK